MIHERSAGAVVFVRDSELKFLLLHYHNQTLYWGLPRGNIESGEDEEQTALREIVEETGLANVTLIPGFREKVHWYYMLKGKKIFKEVVFFIAETASTDVTISKEHVGYCWVGYDKARKTVTFANAREILEKAYKFLAH
jgi:bis(5'-nucleosidyl)-tetraphosphatase